MKKVKTILHNTLFVICAASFLSCLVTFFAGGCDPARMNLFGYRTSFVLSESMEPTIMTHALCLTDMVHKDVKVGDVVVYRHTYEDGPTVLIVHRVIEIRDDGIVTKGDNNEEADGWVTPKEDIIGKIIHVWNGFAKVYDA